MSQTSLYVRVVRALALAVALSMSLYHLYVGFFGTPDAFTLRATHVGFALVLTFLILPAREADRGKGPRIWDWALIALSFAAAAYPVLVKDYIYSRFIYIDDLRTADIVLGVTLTVLVIEAARRALGLVLPITVVLFLGYALLLTNTAPLLLLEQLYLTTEGIFGIPVAVSATYVVLFILFGALVERSGAGKLFMDFAISLTGHTAGGPAKVACVTSGLFGSVSGIGGRQRDDDGHLHDPPDEAGLGYPRALRPGAVEAVALDGRADHAADHGRGRLVMAEFIGRELPHGRDLRPDPGGPLLHRGLLRGPFRGAAARHARAAARGAAEALRGPARARTSVPAARRHHRRAVLRLQRAVLRPVRDPVGDPDRAPAQDDAQGGVAAHDRRRARGGAPSARSWWRSPAPLPGS